MSLQSFITFVVHVRDIYRHHFQVKVSDQPWIDYTHILRRHFIKSINGFVFALGSGLPLNPLLTNRRSYWDRFCHHHKRKHASAVWYIPQQNVHASMWVCVPNLMGERNVCWLLDYNLVVRIVCWCLLMLILAHLIVAYRFFWRSQCDARLTATDIRLGFFTLPSDPVFWNRWISWQ